MLAGDRGYPCLVDGVRLVHPEGTDEYFAYHCESGERWEMNEVAYEMLWRMNGSRSAEEICAAVCDEFAGAETVREDLDALIDDLTAQGCVELRPGGGKEKRNE